MHIPLTWAIALAAAGALGVIVALGIASHRGVIAAPERALAHVAYLLGGGLAGFLTLAFPPAWPALAAVVGMLMIRSVQEGRILDVGLLVTGFGSVWTLLLGLRILNAAADPAVQSPDVMGWFVFSAAVVVAGLAMAIADSASPGRQV